MSSNDDIIINIGGSADDFINSLDQASSAADNAANKMGGSMEKMAGVMALSMHAMTKAIQESIGGMSSAMASAMSGFNPGAMLSALQNIEAGINKMAASTAASAAVTSSALTSIASAAEGAAKKATKASSDSQAAVDGAAEASSKSAKNAMANIASLQSTLNQLISMGNTSINFKLDTQGAENSINSLQERFKYLSDLAHGAIKNPDVASEYESKFTPFMDDISEVIANRISTVLDNSDSGSGGKTSVLDEALQSARKQLQLAKTRRQEISDKIEKKEDPDEVPRDYLDISVPRNLTHIVELLNLRLRAEKEVNTEALKRAEVLAKVMLLEQKRFDLDARISSYNKTKKDGEDLPSIEVSSRFEKMADKKAPTDPASYFYERNIADLEVDDELLKSFDKQLKAQEAILKSREKTLKAGAEEEILNKKLVDLSVRYNSILSANIQLEDKEKEALSAIFSKAKDQNEQAEDQNAQAKEHNGLSQEALNVEKQRLSVVEDIIKNVEQKNKFLLDEEKTQQKVNQLLREFSSVQASRDRAKATGYRTDVLGEDNTKIANALSYNSGEKNVKVDAASIISGTAEEIRSLFVNAVKAGKTEDIQKVFSSISLDVAKAISEAAQEAAHEKARKDASSFSLAANKALSEYAAQNMRKQLLISKGADKVGLDEVFDEKKWELGAAPKTADHLDELELGAAPKTAGQLDELKKITQERKEILDRTQAQLSIDKETLVVYDHVMEAMRRIVDYREDLLSLARRTGQSEDEVETKVSALRKKFYSVDENSGNVTLPFDNSRSSSAALDSLKRDQELARYKEEAARNLDAYKAAKEKVGAPLTDDEYKKVAESISSAKNVEQLEKASKSYTVTPEMKELHRQILAIQKAFKEAGEERDRLFEKSKKVQSLFSSMSATEKTDEVTVSPENMERILSIVQTKDHQKVKDSYKTISKLNELLDFFKKNLGPGEGIPQEISGAKDYKPDGSHITSSEQAAKAREMVDKAARNNAAFDSLIKELEAQVKSRTKKSQLDQRAAAILGSFNRLQAQEDKFKNKSGGAELQFDAATLSDDQQKLLRGELAGQSYTSGDLRDMTSIIKTRRLELQEKITSATGGAAIEPSGPEAAKALAEKRRIESLDIMRGILGKYSVDPKAAGALTDYEKSNSESISSIRALDPNSDISSSVKASRDELENARRRRQAVKVMEAKFALMEKAGLEVSVQTKAAHVAAIASLNDKEISDYKKKHFTITAEFKKELEDYKEHASNLRALKEREAKAKKELESLAKSTGSEEAETLSKQSIDVDSLDDLSQRKSASAADKGAEILQETIGFAFPLNDLESQKAVAKKYEDLVSGLEKKVTEIKEKAAQEEKERKDKELENERKHAQRLLRIEIDTQKKKEELYKKKSGKDIEIPADATFDYESAIRGADTASENQLEKTQRALQLRKKNLADKMLQDKIDSLGSEDVEESGRAQILAEKTRREAEIQKTKFESLLSRVSDQKVIDDVRGGTQFSRISAIAKTPDAGSSVPTMAEAKALENTLKEEKELLSIRRQTIQALDQLRRTSNLSQDEYNSRAKTVLTAEKEVLLTLHREITLQKEKSALASRDKASEAAINAAQLRLKDEHDRAAGVVRSIANESTPRLRRDPDLGGITEKFKSQIEELQRIRDAAIANGTKEEAAAAQVAIREKTREYRERLALLREFIGTHNEAQRVGLKRSTATLKQDIKEVLTYTEENVHTLRERLASIREDISDKRAGGNYLAEFQGAANQVQSIGRQMVGVANMISHTVMEALSSTAHYFENIRVMADETAVSLEEGQRMLGMFMQYGVSASRSEQAIKMLSRLYTDALERGGAALQKFNDMGISMGNLASTGGDVYKIFTMVHDHLLKIEDPLKRAAAATALVGRSNTMVIPVLTASSEALKEARNNTVVMGRDSTEAILRLSAAYEQFKITLQMITAGVLVHSSSTIQGFMKVATDAARAFLTLGDKYKDFIAFFASSAGAFAIVTAAIGSFITIIGALATTIGGIAYAITNVRTIIIGLGTAFGLVSLPVAGVTAAVLALAAAFGGAALQSSIATKSMQHDMEEAENTAQRLERERNIRQQRGDDGRNLSRYKDFGVKADMTISEKDEVRRNLVKEINDIEKNKTTLEEKIKEAELSRKLAILSRKTQSGVDRIDESDFDRQNPSYKAEIEKLKKEYESLSVGRVEKRKAIDALNLVDPSDSPEALAAKENNINFMNQKKWDEQYNVATTEMRSRIKKRDALNKEEIDAWKSMQLKNLEDAQIRNEDVQNMATRVEAQYATFLSSASSANASSVKKMMLEKKREIEKKIKDHEDFSPKLDELKEYDASGIDKMVGDRYVEESAIKQLKAEVKKDREEKIRKIVDRRVAAEAKTAKHNLIIDLETQVGHTRIDDVTGEYIRRQRLSDMLEQYKKERMSAMNSDYSHLTSEERVAATKKLEVELLKLKKQYLGREIVLEEETVKAIKTIREAHANEEKARMDFALEQKREEVKSRFLREELDIVNKIKEGKLSQGNAERELHALALKKREVDVEDARQEGEIKRQSYTAQKEIHLLAIRELEKSIAYYKKEHDNAGSDSKAAEKARRGWDAAFSALSEARTAYTVAERNEWKAYNETIAKVASEKTKALKEDYEHTKKVMEDYAAARKRLNSMEVSWSENAVIKAEESAEAQIDSFREAGKAALEKALQIENAAEMEKEVHTTLRRLTQDETQLRINLLKNLRQAFQTEFSQLFDFLKEVGGLTTSMMKDMLDSIDDEMADMVRDGGADALVSQQFATLRSTQKKIFDELNKNKEEDMSFGGIYDTSGNRVKSVLGFGSFMGGLKGETDAYAEHMRKVLGSSAIDAARKQTKELVSQFTETTSLATSTDTLKTKFYDMSSVVDRLNKELAKMVSNFTEWGTVQVPKKSKYMTSATKPSTGPEEVPDSNLSRDMRTRYGPGRVHRSGNPNGPNPDAELVSPRRHQDPPVPGHTPHYKVRQETVNNLHSTVIINGATVSGVAKKIMEDSVAVLNSKVLSAGNNGLSSFSV